MSANGRNNSRRSCSALTGALSPSHGVCVGAVTPRLIPALSTHLGGAPDIRRSNRRQSHQTMSNGPSGAGFIKHLILSRVLFACLFVDTTQESLVQCIQMSLPSPSHHLRPSLAERSINTSPNVSIAPRSQERRNITKTINIWMYQESIRAIDNLQRRKVNSFFPDCIINS